MNIYVGNLPFKAKDGDIRAEFENYGEVASVKIIMDHATKRSKGFGFVEMPNDAEANAAVAALNGKDMLDRKLNVSVAKSPTGENRSRSES